MSDNQTIAVKRALDLTVYISKTEQKLKHLYNEKFESTPIAPVQERFEAKYPEIKPVVNFLSIELLPALICWPWIFIYYFVIYSKKKKAEYERIKNSVEYKQQCADIDREIARKQTSANEKYQAELKLYNEITLPEYNQKLSEWTKSHNEEIANTVDKLNEAKNQLNFHYENTKIIPLQYRYYEAIKYIYDMISSSDYSIKEALENYDKKEQRELDRARLEEQQLSNQLADEQNQLAYEQNDLLEQQNSIARKARRDSNIANVVGTVQRHNTNKSLEKIVKK